MSEMQYIDPQPEKINITDQIIRRNNRKKKKKKEKKVR
jgi:hypothetical protein